MLITNILSQCIKSLSLLIPLLLAVAFITLFERKVIAFMQLRLGPNIIGFEGLLQPIADAAKLFTKETIIPNTANKLFFLFAPITTIFLSFATWAVVPLNTDNIIADLNLAILYLFAISSLNVYGIILAGWASNSRYAFLGALRSAAQMLSYEISIGLMLLPIFIIAKSLNLSDIVNFQNNYIWFLFPLFPSFLIFVVAILAETNRPPFDLPEAEGELVAGYNVEYSAISFALFFIGEYLNILLNCTLTTLLFLGGWTTLVPSIRNSFAWLEIKILIILIIFLWARALLPRIRYDQLMYFGWKILLPITLLLIITITPIVILLS